MIRDLNVWYMMLQGFNLVVLIAWIVLAIAALIKLRRSQLEPIAKVLWVIVVLLIPIIGAVAFFIVGAEKITSHEG